MQSLSWQKLNSKSLTIAVNELNLCYYDYALLSESLIILNIICL